ncbi:hypothetical protein [Streptomyces sp. NPDC053069]|uniref:hypothetical protein n=1 Tax=Streptomyces sp. NPDC053069 TaxID=3365695 RepID=UPI0037D4685C
MTSRSVRHWRRAWEQDGADALRRAVGAGARRGGNRGVEGRGVAAGKRTAAHLGALICFEDESGQGLRPSRGRTWAPRGQRPLVRVRGRSQGRVNITGVVCWYRAGHRSVPLLLHAAHLARAPRRAEGVLLAPVPRSDRHASRAN